MVKRGIQRAVSVVNNGNKNVSLSLIDEVRQDDGSQQRILEQEKQTEHDQMSVGNLTYSLADNEPPMSDDVNKSDEIFRMDEELITAPTDTQETCRTVPSWSDSITNDTDAERDHEKQGKKREKPQHSKEDNQRDMENDDNNTDAGITPLPPTA